MRTIENEVNESDTLTNDIHENTNIEIEVQKLQKSSHLQADGVLQTSSLEDIVETLSCSNSIQTKRFFVQINDRAKIKEYFT